MTPLLPREQWQRMLRPPSELDDPAQLSAGTLMGTGCSRESTPVVEPTIATPAPSTPTRGSPKMGRRYTCEPLEGGTRPVRNLDISLRQLLRTNEGAPAFYTDEKRGNVAYRVLLHPPPFELQNSRGQQVVQLFRDTKHETPSLIVLNGKSTQQTNIWGGTQPATQYDIRIPASTLLDDRDLDAGVAYRGQLTIGSPRDTTGKTRETHWLIR